MQLGRVLFGILVLSVLPGAAAQIDRTCPSGTYYGLDNQQNPACRDLETNQIVDAQTGLMYDSHTSELILDDLDDIHYVIVILFVIGIITVAVKRFRKSHKRRRGWTMAEKTRIRRKQNGRCAMCSKYPPRWEYDHKDNNRHNNNLSNCQGLCPNCHAQKTYDN